MKTTALLPRVFSVASVLVALGASGTARADVPMSPQTKLLPTSWTTGKFGSSVAIRNNGTALIGSPAAHVNGSQAGAVSEGNGAAFGLLANAQRGFAVAYSGEVKVSSAPGQKKVYFATSWTSVIEIASTLNGFGGAVGADALGQVIVGAPDDGGGKAVVYKVDAAGSVSGPESLTASVPSGAAFGFAVGIDGDTAVVGAPNYDSTGRVMIFERQAGSWSLVLNYADSTLATLGNGVSLQGDRVAVGAWRSNVNGVPQAGAVAILKRTFGTWGLEQVLTAADSDANDHFGRSVALDGTRLLVGANLDDEAGTDAGAVYVFDLQGSTWAQSAKIVSESPAAGEYFGTSVGLSNRHAVVGAWGNDETGTDGGAAYRFDFLQVEQGGACAADGHCATGHCVDGVCCDQACGDGQCQACSAALGASADGTCTALVGAACDDGDLCTTGDACQAAGSCGAGVPVTCAAPDECHVAGSCDPEDGQCSAPTESPDGTACTGGTCAQGICDAVGGGGGGGGAGGSEGTGGSVGEGGSGSEGGSAGTGGSASDGGSNGAGASSSSSGGSDDGDPGPEGEGEREGEDAGTTDPSGCRAASGDASTGAGWSALWGLAIIAGRSRRRAIAPR